MSSIKFTLCGGNPQPRRAQMTGVNRVAARYDRVLPSTPRVLLVSDPPSPSSRFVHRLCAICAALRLGLGSNPSHRHDRLPAHPAQVGIIALQRTFPIIGPGIVGVGDGNANLRFPHKKAVFRCLGVQNHSTQEYSQANQNRAHRQDRYCINFLQTSCACLKLDLERALNGIRI